MKTPASFVALCTLAAFGGCVTDDTLDSGELDVDVAAAEIEITDIGDVGTLPILPLCTSVAPHKSLYVGPGYNIPGPPYFTNSNDSAYHYSGCGRFVADVYVAANSPAFTIEGMNYDLPASSGDDLYGRYPTNAVDCDEYREHVTIWHKKGAGAWSEIRKGSYRGAWSSGQCYPQLYSGANVYLERYTTAGAGWDVFRVAVAIKERRSPQTAAVGLEYPPPQ